MSIFIYVVREEPAEPLNIALLSLIWPILAVIVVIGSLPYIIAKLVDDNT